MPVLPSTGLIRPTFGITPTANLLVKIGMYVYIQNIFSHASHVMLQSCLSVTPVTVAPQAPLSMEFSRQEYWSGLPSSSPGNLPDPEFVLASPAAPAL